jgi:hypothetical protein
MGEQHEAHEQQAVIAQGEPHGVSAVAASVGVPDFDLSKVLPEGGMLSPAAAVLGGLAIAGGVALKVVPAWLKSRAEMATQRLALKAKRLELEQKAKQDEQGGDCASRHAACIATVAALEERLKLVERQADGLASEVASAKDAATKLSLSGDASVDSERVGKLEEQVAKLQAKVGA